jgi:hypothetical protein
MMANGERTSTVGWDDLRVRLATMVGAGAGAAIALLWRPDVGGFWLGLLAFAAVLTAGMLIGRLAGSLLFRKQP